MTTRGHQRKYIESKDTWNRKNFSNKEFFNTKEQVQASAENLKNNTIDSSISSIDTRSNLMVQQTGLEHERDIHSLTGFTSIIDKLLEEIEDTKLGTSKKGLTKAGQRTMKEAKAKLKQYEKQLKGKKKGLSKGKLEINDNDIINIRNTWQQLNKIREDIGMGQWGEYSNIASYLYNSPENIKKAKKYQASSSKFNQKMEKELREVTRQNIRQIPTLSRETNLGHSGGSKQFYESGNPLKINSGTNGVPKTGNGERIETVPSTNRTTIDYSHTSRGETFKKGGINGLFDKILTTCSNMTPGQRGTREALGLLSIIGGVIYGQYKFYTSKKIGWGRKAGLTVLPFFASQFVTGKDPITLFSELLTGGLTMNEIKHKYGNTLGGISSSKSRTAKATVPAIQSTMVFNPKATVGDVQRITQSFKKDNQNRTNFYQQSCTKIQKRYGPMAAESFQSTFSENFDEKKWNNRLASFGVTGGTHNREPIYSLADNTYTNQIVIEKFLEENNLKITENPTKKAEFNMYIKSKNEKNELINNNDLKSHTDRFKPIQEQPETNHKIPEQQIKNNPKLPEQQDTKNIELTQENLKPSIDEGLSKIFKHFRSIYGKKINYIRVNEKHIPKYSPGITRDILSKSIKKSGNSITIDMSDNYIKTTYDNAVENLAQSQGGLLNTFGTLSKEIREHKRDKIKAFKEKGQINDYNERKNNITDIVKILFENIVKDLESQGRNIKITRNGQNFYSVNDAISAQQILN